MALKQADKERLALYSSRCKTCKHLDPAEAKAYSVCHYTKGNEHCPAAEIQFVVVGAAYRMAKQVLTARDRRDLVVETEILAKVAKQPEAFQERFYAALENPNPESIL